MATNPRILQKSDTAGLRAVLSSEQEIRAALARLVASANRTLSILTRDLEPQIYDHDEFLEPLKRFILARTFARVRVLIYDPNRAIKDGNRFVTMGRRLNSYIEFRNVKPHLRGRVDAFCIADEHALVYRARADKWSAVSDLNAPAVARRYLDEFDELWQACELEPELRQMHL
jgi:hypothetical protein